MDEQGTRNLFNHVMEIWVTPELERRKIEGKLPQNFEIDKIQILVKPVGVPEVRFNQEVNAIVIVRLKVGIKKAVLGEPVHFNEIEDILDIQMTEDDNPNFGHLTMILFQKGWKIRFDFRTNKKIALERFKAGQEFLKAAYICFNEGFSRAFIDVLFSAVELFVTSQLFVTLGPIYTMKPNHKKTSLKYNEFINTGNYKSEFKLLFNKLTGLRDRARYLKEIFELTNNDAKIMLETARELSEYTRRRIM